MGIDTDSYKTKILMCFSANNNSGIAYFFVLLRKH